LPGEAEVGPRFNISLIMVGLLTLLAAVAIVISLFVIPDPTAAQQSTEEWLRATAETGMGLFVGLVKGRTSN